MSARSNKARGSTKRSRTGRASKPHSRRKRASQHEVVKHMRDVWLDVPREEWDRHSVNTKVSSTLLPAGDRAKAKGLAMAKLARRLNGKQPSRYVREECARRGIA